MDKREFSSAEVAFHSRVERGIESDGFEKIGRCTNRWIWQGNHEQDSKCEESIFLRHAECLNLVVAAGAFETENSFTSLWCAVNFSNKGKL